MKSNPLLTQAKRLFNYKSYLKTNIIRSASSQRRNLGQNISFTPGGTKFNSNTIGTTVAGALGSTNDKLLSVYYRRLEELRKYEMTDLAETIVGLFKDYITGSVVKVKNPVTITNEEFKKYESLANRIVEDLGLISTMLENLDDIIYYGSYAFGIKKDPETSELVKLDLFRPSEVVTIWESGGLYKHIVYNEEGHLVTAAPRSIVKLGNESLILTNDLNQADYEEDKNSIFKRWKFKSSRPIFYGIVEKVKEHLLKDKLISLLGIKDLIQPLLLLVKVENGTTEEAATKIARQTEQLINNYVDTSTFLAGSFSIEELIQAIVNNIKVLPDFNSSLENLGTLDLTKLSEKLEQIKANQDQAKEDILNATGVPLDLFMNRATKYEAIKTSERLNSKVNYYVSTLRSSTKKAVVDLLYLYTGVEISAEDITLNCFKKTAIEYSNIVNNSDVVSSVLDAVKTIIENAERFATDTKLLNPEAFLKMVRTKLEEVDTELSEVITDEDITKFIEQKYKQDAEGGDSAHY